MNEALHTERTKPTDNAELLDSELLRDAEATNQRPALADDQVATLAEGDEVKTVMRLPAPTPPPPPMTTMMPPPMPHARPSMPPPSMPVPAAYDRSFTHIAPEAPPPGKPSWLNALLTSTLPPPVALRDASTRAPIAPTTAGAIFAALGLVFAVLALVTGLRGAPDDSITPVVAAAVVIARALVTLGAGALSFVLLRSAERLLVDSSPKQP